MAAGRCRLGYIKAQHRLGLLYLQSACGIEDLYLAYKWLFISIALGNVSATADLVEVNVRFDSDESDKGYELAEYWFEEKFDESWERDESRWSPELLRWRFAPSLVQQIETVGLLVSQVILALSVVAA